MAMSPLHTDREYEAELTQLRELLLLMGARVEAQLSDALGSFVANDAQAAQALIGSDEEVDQLEVRADEACVQLLAKRQPVARDLRFVMTTLKVVTDLERIGDLACNIGKLVVEGVAGLEPEARKLTEEMGRVAVAMVHDVIDALVESDPEKAKAVIERDRWVDATCADLSRSIAKRIAEQPSEVEAYMRLVAITRSIERVADHSTNLAEMVVFLVKGRDVRHLRRVSTAGASGSHKVH